MNKVLSPKEFGLPTRTVIEQLDFHDELRSGNSQ